MEKATKQTLLIVDDDEINRAPLVEAFKDSYIIIESEDGKDAVEIINSRNDIAAVLLDMIMPVMGGIDVLREMNKSGKISEIPVFIITAAESKSLLMDAYNLGASDVIQKPAFMPFVKCRIGNIIELNRHRTDLESMLDEKVARLNLINTSMIEALANIIEFRDGESGALCIPNTICLYRKSKKFPPLLPFTTWARLLYPTAYSINLADLLPRNLR